MAHMVGPSLSWRTPGMDPKCELGGFLPRHLSSGSKEMKKKKKRKQDRTNVNVHTKDNIIQKSYLHKCLLSFLRTAMVL